MTFYRKHLTSVLVFVSQYLRICYNWYRNFEESLLPSSSIRHLQPFMSLSLLFRGSEITHKDAPQSVGLLWTSDQPVAETST
jgi:hypothetical protein